MPETATLRFAPIAGFGITAAIAYGLWWLAGGPQSSSTAQLIYWLASLAAALVVSLLIFRWSQGQIRIRQMAEEARRNDLLRHSLESRLDGVIRLNKLLIDAQSEKDLIESSLSVMADISGALGSSFLPFDEWGIALTPHIYGDFPPPVLRAWVEHLSSASVRQSCHTCRKLNAKGGEHCDLPGAPFMSESIRVYCLPLTRNERMVGMLNLYLPAERSLAEHDFEFVHVLLNEMVLAIEAMRLRNQELTTLRQLQMALSQKDDVEESVRRVVEGLGETIDFESARIEIKPAEPRFPGLRLTIGDPSWLDSPVGQALMDRALSALPKEGGARVTETYVDEAGIVLSTPIRLAGSAVIGALILTADPEIFMQRQQLSLIETAAEQIAMLLENQRVQLDAHYRIVMQERIRLAREIHDSLAQTLAYLKLTATQMQSMLAHGDLTRLEQTLNQSYQALSQAYLETREVIDNLRITPRQSFADLIEQLALDFKKSSGIKVETKFSASVPEAAPEVQTQLLRVVQEALSNVRKHAHARRVNISLGVWNRQLQLEVCDDGVGFDAEDVPEFSRHGLQGMRERAELIGADFQIVSQSGKGTCIRVQVPVRMEEKAA